MEIFTVSRDDRYHEAWPTVCTAANGDLICSYSEGDVHGGGAVPSAVVRISRDEGRNWSEPIVVDTLMERPESGFFMCRSVIRLLDGSLLLAVDWEKAPETAIPVSHNWFRDPANDGIAEVRLYRSQDNGKTWTGPEYTGCLAVSMNMKQTSDGTVYISGSQYRSQGRYWAQFLYPSKDNGKTWGDPITVLDSPEYWAAEGDLVEIPDGELVMYLRGGLMKDRILAGYKMISKDGGATWKGPFAAGKWPMTGRINAERLTCGDVMVVHRVGGFTLQKWFGFFIEPPDTALQETPFDNKTWIRPSKDVRWNMIDNDRSPHPDWGYGGLTELPSGDVYVVNYTVDDAPKNRPQIRGYRISKNELQSPVRDLTVDFEPPLYKRGKLVSQNGWVRHKPEFWNTRGLSLGSLGELGNYIIVDTSGSHSYSGKASITGTRNHDGKEEVIRRDIGPYDLQHEKTGITLIHKGRQNCGIFRVLDAAGNTMVELHSDFIFNRLWAHDNQGWRAISLIDSGESWWQTKIAFTKGKVEIFTRITGATEYGKPWASFTTDSLTSDVAEDEVSRSLRDIISALVIAAGEQGGFYIDRIEIVSEKT